MARKKVPVDKNNGREIFRFLQKSYDEAFELLVSSRDYFSDRGKTDKMLLSKEDQLVYTLAVSTITTQLTSVMSWLLLCKAVEQGEISRKQLRSGSFEMPEFNLGINEKDSCFSILNKKTREFLSKSCNLYNRMKRMESSIREQLLEVI